MTKIMLIARMIRIFLPQWLARWVTPNREEYRGALIDVKAVAVGRLANQIRGDGPMPTVEESRVQMAKMASQLDRKAPEIMRTDDITVAGADGPLMARLFSNQSRGGPASPAMVYFHGGGFVQGDLETHHDLCAKIAKWWGGVVIAIDYRLAPENPFPAGVDDSIAAYLDIVNRASELGLDAAKIGVGGDSAGGCFAAVVAQQVRNSGGPIPRFQVLIYPVTDGHIDTVSVNELAQAYVLPKARMIWYRDMYAGAFSDFDDPKFSPLLADDFTGLPDSYIVTGGFDPLVDDGAEYVDSLQKAGVRAIHRHFEGQVHAFVNLTKVVPDGTVALREISGWLKGVCPPAR